MLGKKLAIDLGSNTVRVLVRGENAMIDEPAIVARGADGATSVGRSAVRAVRERHAQPIRPLTRTSVADDEALHVLVGHMLNRAIGRQRIFKPDVVAVVHSEWSGVDRRHLLDDFAANGTRTVYLLDSPLAAALGAGVSTTAARLVLDLGAQTTEAAVVAQEACVAGASIPRGGDDLAAELCDAASAQWGVPVSRETGPELVRLVASAQRGATRHAAIAVDDSLYEVESSVFTDVVDEHLRAVVAMTRDVLAATPRKFMDEILTGGALITGGGALLHGITARLSSELGLPVVAPDAPELCAVRGAATAADSLDMLKRTFLYIR